jgi:lysophospholipase
MDNMHKMRRISTKLLCFSFTGPTVGIAVSGGGFRAALVGAGTFAALDGRNSSAVQDGTGGVWQLASYMTGLSGGSWFVSSLAINSNPPIQDLVLGSPTFQG